MVGMGGEAAFRDHSAPPALRGKRLISEASLPCRIVTLGALGANVA